MDKTRLQLRPSAHGLGFKTQRLRPSAHRLGFKTRLQLQPSAQMLMYNDRHRNPTAPLNEVRGNSVTVYQDHWHN